MIKVKSFWNVLSKFFIIFGIPIFLIGIFYLIIKLEWVFIFNGSLWITLGIIAKIKFIYDEYKLKKLKKLDFVMMEL